MNVFYSWQSDTPNKIGRGLIREALDAAIAGLQVDDAERPTVDQDTQGVLGSPPIADTILDKIRNAQIVVADVTLTGETPDGKRLANSNVCIELGYALGVHGHTALLKVMNTHYGPPTDLPFDLAHRRWPVQYRLAPNASSEERKRELEKLTRTLRGILQQYIHASPQPSAPAVASFVPTPPTVNRAAYWRAGELIAREGQLGYGSNEPLVYLRVWPRDDIPQLTAALMSDYHILNVEPLAGRGLGWSRERNRYGVITYVEKSESLWSTTQVFKTGEIWGIDASMLRKAEHLDDNIPNLVPTGHYERGVQQSLRTYLKVAREHFRYPRHVMVESGLVNVEGYKLAMPSDFALDRFWGPLYEDVRTVTEVDSEDSESIEAALLRIYEALYEAAGRPRPTNLYDFPGPAL